MSAALPGANQRCTKRHSAIGGISVALISNAASIKTEESIIDVTPQSSND